MKKIITIGREFGSGGRELGRRLAEKLHIAYYDREIVTEISKRTELSEQYVQQIVEQKPLPLYPIHVGQSFYPIDALVDPSQQIYQQQSLIIKEMANKGDCVIVGRCADYILKDMKPFRIFVYADMASKIARCRSRDKETEPLSDKALRANIIKLDRGRARYYEFYTGQAWGLPLSYDALVNTSNQDIAQVADALARLFQ